MRQPLKTIAIIEAPKSAEPHRAHLGASAIGNPCARANWYTFRWCKAQVFEPRMLRLFDRGQREEATLVNMLQRIPGVTVHAVDPATGKQFAYRAPGGHFGGSMDGACVGLPDDPDTWHVLEFKTHGEKSFNALAKHGVAHAKPEHVVQMQCYMHWSGLTRALYMGVCKNTDRLHLEIVDYDEQQASTHIRNALAIVEAPEPPERLSADPEFFACKFCHHAPVCHSTQAPEVNCRTCLSSTPVDEGQWTCARHPAKMMTVYDQRTACPDHVYIPPLLANIGHPSDADEAATWVEYTTADGKTFRNGQPPGAFASREIYACQDKAALTLVASEFAGLREEFGAEVVG